MFREIVKPFTGMMHDIFGKFCCSVCQKKVVSFNPLSAYYSDNFKKYAYKGIGHYETCNIDQYKCPRCGSTDRDRLYAIYIRQFTGKQLTNSVTVFSILDLAPNKALSSFIRSELLTRPNVLYRTADLYRDWADDKVDIMNMHIYRNAQFDFFICSHVLEHIKDDRKALRELYRILREGGRGILMVPIDLTSQEINEDPNCTDIAEQWRRFGGVGHVRQYSKQGFVDRILEAGFDLEQVGVERFGIEQFIKHGITQQSILYIVRKPQE